MILDLKIYFLLSYLIFIAFIIYYSHILDGV